ncbi:hypothetical protein [Niveibacterium sp. SC-1]|uniref:hypothetical protein n=1 Tax=Niveibacterium sp. SC-1 TaxID=3135646 RepID=UPI00311D4EEA
MGGSVLRSLSLCMLAGLGSAPALAQSNDSWQFSVQPYLWLPTINTKLRFTAPSGGYAPESQIGPYDWLNNMQAMLMVAGEARKGDWAIITDLVYLSFKDDHSTLRDVDFNSGGLRNRVSTTINASAETSLKGLEWTLAGSKMIARTPTATVEVLGGVRYFGIKAEADWQGAATITSPNASASFPASGNISENVDLWNAVIGVRGVVNFGQSPWFMPYYADLGFGSDSTSWQAMAGIGYGFKWGSLRAVYRYIAYDQSDDKLVQNLSFGGPAVSAAFSF